MGLTEGSEAPNQDGLLPDPSLELADLDGGGAAFGRVAIARALRASLVGKSLYFFHNIGDENVIGVLDAVLGEDGFDSPGHGYNYYKILYSLFEGVLGFWGDRKSTRLNSSH